MSVRFACLPTADLSLASELLIVPSSRLRYTEDAIDEKEIEKDLQAQVALLLSWHTSNCD